jgi:hypothetical protein
MYWCNDTVSGKPKYSGKKPVPVIGSWNNSAPTGRVERNSVFDDFSKHSKKIKFLSNLTRTAVLHM